jgi:monoamine oxidase
MSKRTPDRGTKGVDRKPPVGDKKPKRVKTAIIGGGIAGLYCAYRLTEKGEVGFLIAEETNHLGGRIWSTRVLENGNILPDATVLKPNKKLGFCLGRQRLEFCAEFGPMRLELELQELLKELLLKKLGMHEKTDLEPFPPYGSPTSEHDPKYELKGEELEQATPFDLLILAVVRVLGRLQAAETSDESGEGIHNLDNKLKKLVENLNRAVATRQLSWKNTLIDWIKTLGESDYQNIRQYGIFDDGTKSDDGTRKGTPLWNMGFWNLLSEVLSHHAVMKIRDLGTFYHLIPENPNAAEWLIFWLRGLRTSEQMVGIRGGMQRITHAMVKKIGKDRIVPGHKLIGIAASESGRVALKFANGTAWEAERVILALPKAPLEELVRANKESFYKTLLQDLDSVFSFPMLKLFLIVKERWWDEDVTRTNRYATLVPTRELHYRRSGLQESKKGIILLYTDRPASSFWANYVTQSGAQTEPERGGHSDNPRLVNKVLEYLKEYGLGNRDASEIQFYGIRDWGREPYHGANHAWRPERQSWKILERVSAFTIGDRKTHILDPARGATVHICGEAYSDYHGFIEGALRSAAHVLHKMKPNDFPDTPTRWLCDQNCLHPHSGHPTAALL